MLQRLRSPWEVLRVRLSIASPRGRGSVGAGPRCRLPLVCPQRRGPRAGVLDCAQPPGGAWPLRLRGRMVPASQVGVARQRVAGPRVAQRAQWGLPSSAALPSLTRPWRRSRAPISQTGNQSQGCRGVGKAQGQGLCWRIPPPPRCPRPTSLVPCFALPSFLLPLLLFSSVPLFLCLLLVLPSFVQYC